MDELYISDDTIRDEGDLPTGLTLETPPGPRFEALIADITDTLGATVQLEPLAEEDEREMKFTCDQARGPSPLARHSCRQRAPNVFSPL